MDLTTWKLLVRLTRESSVTSAVLELGMTMIKKTKKQMGPASVDYTRQTKIFQLREAKNGGRPRRVF